MTRIGFLLLFLATLVAPAAWASPAPADAAKGKKLFLDAKCNKCHPVQSQAIEVVTVGGALDEEEEDEIKPPDLSNVAARFKSAAEVQAWITKTSERDGRKHQAVYRGSEEDLRTLVAWLLTLKTAK